MDAWGLGAFTVMGVQRAHDLIWNTNGQPQQAHAEQVHVLFQADHGAGGGKSYCADQIHNKNKRIHATKPFLLVFVGVLTGVGGGILRDLMAQEVPDVFKRNIYACASLAGALLCAALLPVIDDMSALMRKNMLWGDDTNPDTASN